METVIVEIRQTPEIVWWALKAQRGPNHSRAAVYGYPPETNGVIYKNYSNEIATFAVDSITLNESACELRAVRADSNGHKGEMRVRVTAYQGVTRVVAECDWAPRPGVSSGVEPSVSVVRDSLQAVKARVERYYIPKVTAVECGSAKEFLSQLWPGSLTGPPGESGAFLFRGIASKEYQLIPLAHRGDSWLILGRAAVQARDLGDRLSRAEADTAEAFRMRLDEGGHAVPAAGNHVSPAAYPPMAVEDLWPPSTMIPLLGVAQHYGLPTRLMDWSMNPLVAAYFAATSSFDSVEGNEFMSVWKLGPLPTAADRRWVMIYTSRSERPSACIELVRVSRSENRNLAAQDGAFTLVRSLDRPPHPALDDLLRSGWLREGVPPTDGVRYDLSRAHVSEVVAHLEQIGIRGSRMFPHVGGAVRSVVDDIRAARLRAPRT